MNFPFKRIVVSLLVLALLTGAVFWLVGFLGKEKAPQEVEEIDDSPQVLEDRKIIGQSVSGRDIEAYTYGNGDEHLLFVGGIHGGYEWNSVLLAYRFMDYFNDNPEVIPQNVSVSIIPSLNPDGVYEIVGKEGRFKASDLAGVSREAAKPGRFNANEVDLNRNFDCKWKPESTWQGRIVSAGTAPFSEPESQALRDFVSEINPSAVVFWHSQANAVYASECEEGILPETRRVMNAYSNLSGYPAVDSFDHYEITGDAEGWLASIGVAAVTVELESYDDIEWQRNLSGVKALLSIY